MDKDLEKLTREELITEIKKMRQGIRKHRDSTGHDLCWFHPDLWNLLPEKYDPQVSVPHWPQFMAGCVRYRRSLDEQNPGATRNYKEFMDENTVNEGKYNPAAYFEIPVTDMERAIKFYSQVFEIEFERAVIDENEMALFPFYNEKTGISGALAKGEIYKPSLYGSLIYLKTNELEKTLALALKHGATMLYPKTTSEEGYAVAEFKDCEGNRIALHQVMIR